MYLLSVVNNLYVNPICSRPLLSRSGCIYSLNSLEASKDLGFSSPFIEERLYLEIEEVTIEMLDEGSRPLLSRSGCILYELLIDSKEKLVLVPFYRGAVVFTNQHEN